MFNYIWRKNICECDLPLTLGNWLLAIVHLSWLEFELYFHVRCVVASVRWANSRSSSAEIYLSQFDVLYVWCVCVIFERREWKRKNVVLRLIDRQPEKRQN